MDVLLLCWPVWLWALGVGVAGEVLNPPYFNLAEGRQIWASSTCGVGVDEPELYCKLVGANTDREDNPNINLIYGQVCDYCDPKNPYRAHPPENAIDGTENRWQSPPLSRGNKYNEVNVTISLGQEFHVAYVFIKMGNSPRPGVWVLERSKDNGKTYQAWQYFADSPGDCVQNFGPNSLQPLVADDSVICETRFSKVVPLEGGEIVVSLLNDRPNADNFSYSTVLQEFTKATNIRLRFLRTKTLLGHLMSVARQDPTVTRRYFYSIKDINIGGRCVCNGHAETCDLTDPEDQYKLRCRCKHNTDGNQCEYCRQGFQQKAWRRAIIDHPFVCEPCNCFGHSNECIYDEEVSQQRLSLDIHNVYEGGGVCQNCRHNTQGINCNKCKPTFFRPYGKLLNDTDVCQPCNCDPTYSTGNCADGSGQCECRPEYLPPSCRQCNVGYYGYPDFCRPCDCNANGTHGSVCEVGGGQCPCKENYSGRNCDTCKEGFYGFPNCRPCNCHPSHSLGNLCEPENGHCVCRENYAGRQCDRCKAGYYGYPRCDYCSCDATGCLEQICDENTGTCLCKPGFAGPSCSRCAPGYSKYPLCEECNCDPQGSISNVCDIKGQCQCLPNFSGPKCSECAAGYYKFPQCLPCNCRAEGSMDISCDDEGNCPCHHNFDGSKCEICKENFYNYPYCEECNCNPAGVLPTFLGCGSSTSGQLCECKEHVTGRICNECKSLYYNLKSSNPNGCEDCNCFLGGTVGGLAVCAGTNGQCMCKPNVDSRQCSECTDGTYALLENDLFGCKDCGCDIGGSVNNVCNKVNGQCSCRPRITGRRCDKPLQTHYFPSLFQHKYEMEDGRTPAGTQVRIGHSENLFPRFSWRGYAVFSDIQKEIILDLFIEKPSLYQVYMSYLNFGGESVYGIITFTPEAFGDIQQSSDMMFEVSTEPKFMKVSGKQGLVASPFVLNPGRYSVSIRVEKPLFLDYMVLLPQSYYEATLLQEEVSNPCERDSEELCLLFRYPPLPKGTEIMKSVTDFVSLLDEGRRKGTITLDEPKVLNGYIMILTYHNPDKEQGTTAEVEISSSTQVVKGTSVLYDCAYSFLCRQVVKDSKGEVSVFNIDQDHEITLYLDDNSNVAIENVAFVPAQLWHVDYIVPKPMCTRENGLCLESEFLRVPESVKVDFESSYNQYQRPSVPPYDIVESDISLVSLTDDDHVIQLQGTVPSPGDYAFIVHYYQPDYPTFDAKMLLETEDSFEGVLPLPFCPGLSGCRTVGRAKDSDNIAFNIQENFQLTIRKPTNRSAWIRYALAIPVKEYHESVLRPLPVDKAGKFITECGKNSFHLPANVTGFCRDAAFSLTTEYNNGGLSCKCDTDGSLSYACEEFGGACDCKPHVIGRTCSQCRMGYFGFPNCKACDCPSISCHPITGYCICPPRVTGDRCDTCVPYTYGFDSLIGCEECNCHPLGVVNGNLQCNLQTGQCECKSNVVGRTCDRCKAGYYAFPYCELCNCDLRGSTEDICQEDNARCYCKENVYGDSCDQCKPGTFFLEEVNPLGCTKCFCFGTTDRCSSGYFFKQQILDMGKWKGLVISLEQQITEAADVQVQLHEADDGVRAHLPPQLPDNHHFYFAAPHAYLGNKLSSYGGHLRYTLFTATDASTSTESSVGPDLILKGNNMTLVHHHLEQPADGIPFNMDVKIIEHEFHHMSGREVTREQIMMVLVNLDHILLRASYFEPARETRLSEVLMDTADMENYIADSPQALSVELCQCPPSYRGASCESCAPGYYRSKTGPYLGYCVPCECHGHAQTCDVNTGKCMGCQHNTVGDHCEKCMPGYHGDSTQGTPYDCLICACPLPIESNNFAESCEVSPSGAEISCNCKPGYYGGRCEVCDIGFFGSPEVLGSTCQPCQCSGNIDASRKGSCDSVTGDCILCLNNTFGSACQLCKPGFYGDAISKKDCRQCDCDSCGTQSCDHESGQCFCRPNVEGERCDRCKRNHYGFSTCGGCRSCDCGAASRSEQCDLETGQCPCQFGAGTRTCDICEPGYWNYTANGCISCNCNAKYSAGEVCNSATGQCGCLRNVLGEKCDGCPHRWVFIPKSGCFECETCVHHLLDETDLLEQWIAPVMIEMKDVSLSYFANRRLQNINSTADTLRIGVNELVSDPSGRDHSHLVYEVESVEKLRDALDRTAMHLHAEAETVRTDGNKTEKDAREVGNLIGGTVVKVQDIIDGLFKLSEGLLNSLGPNLDNLISQAETMLAHISQQNFDEFENASAMEFAACEDLLDQVKVFEMPVLGNLRQLEGQQQKLDTLKDLLNDLKVNSEQAYLVAASAQQLHRDLRNIPLQKHINEIEEKSVKVSELLGEATQLLDNTKNLIGETEQLFVDLERKADGLLLSIRNLKDQISEIEETFSDIQYPVQEAAEHATFLTEQADILDRSLADTRHSSDGAVQAAKAYGNIEEAITNAFEAAQSALEKSNSAEIMSGGIIDRTSHSKNSTSHLLQSAAKLDESVTELEPQLSSAKSSVLFTSFQHDKSVKGHDAIKKDLAHFSTKNLLEVAAGDAAREAAAANEVAESALLKMEEIEERLPNDRVAAKQVPRDFEDSRQALKAAQSYADRVSSIVPETNLLIDKVSKDQSKSGIIGTDLSEKIAKLQKKVAIARTQANRIKLGVQFFENTTLQVRNPVGGMQRAATYTYLSLYFITTQRYGLLAFVGNEKGAHAHMKRVLTSDYMSLEIRGGRIVLTMDIGSGSQVIKHDSYVSDGKWHQVIVERTGKMCTITVSAEDQEKSVVEGYLPGTYSVFNLDPRVSKFFIGGIPESLMLPDTLENFNFDGCIQDVEFGESPVSLWDFVSAKNNLEGCERNELTVVSSNGLRFNGAGYAILKLKKHQFSSETHIKMHFKTYAKEGLLFLIGKSNNFFALEMKDGHVLLKMNLGSGTMILQSPGTYNDGLWHSLEANRVDQDAVLKVDLVEVASGSTPGSEDSLSVTKEIFVGGYPRRHSYPITNLGFEGCIMDMQISAEVIDLNKNKEALGVANGCPVTIARTVSFSNVSSGYIAMPPEDLEKLAQLTFKFKTSEEHGLIFYASNEDHSNYLFIGLQNGDIVMRSQPGGVIRTRDVKYNDLEWHYVSATKTLGQMRLDIDDFFSVETELAQDNALVQTTSPMYFAGVPDDVTVSDDILPIYQPFVGCLGDTTVNNKFQNFADSRDKKSASMASCPLPDPFDEHGTTTLEVTSVAVDTPSSTPGSVEEDFTEEPEGPESIPIGQCVLPPYPRKDTSVKRGDGVRFGSTPHSRQQFSKQRSFMDSILDDSTFALEFKSFSTSSGIVFYVAGNNHIDYVGLLMQNGKIIYVFNCGAGSAVISSQNSYNDGLWHRVVFSRQGQDGRLVLDDEEEVRGSSVPGAKSVNVKAPFYVGGLPEEVAREAKNNLRGVRHSFPGCIRNVEAQGELLTAEKPAVARNVTGCSNQVEEGTFFQDGYLTLYDKYSVGEKISILLDIKPRNLSGTLLAVHGKEDFLILQMIEGRIAISVDNGAGPITAVFYPSEKHYLCDGQFHTVQVSKTKNVVTLNVDGKFSEIGIGVGGVSSTNTNDPLYIGGLPESAFSRKGVETTERFVGCLRYLELDEKPQSLSESRVFGQVTLNTCPTI